MPYVVSSRNKEGSTQLYLHRHIFQQLLVWLLYIFLLNVKKHILFIRYYVQLVNKPIWLQTFRTPYNTKVRQVNAKYLAK